MTRRSVVVAALAGLAAGLVVAAAVTAATDTRAAPNLVGGVLLGLVGGLGSSILRGGTRRRDG